MQSKARDCLALWLCWIKRRVAPELCEDSEEEAIAKDDASLRHKEGSWNGTNGKSLYSLPASTWIHLPRGIYVLLAPSAQVLKLQGK